MVRYGAGGKHADLNARMPSHRASLLALLPVLLNPTARAVVRGQHLVSQHLPRPPAANRAGVVAVAPVVLQIHKGVCGCTQCGCGSWPANIVKLNMHVWHMVVGGNRVEVEANKCQKRNGNSFKRSESAVCVCVCARD